MDFIRPEGRLHIEFFEPGQPVRTLHVTNNVVIGGLRWMAARLGGTSAESTGKMALGNGSSAVSIGDSSLQAETARQSLTAIETAEPVANEPAAVYTTTFAAGLGTGNVSEMGLFLTGGVLVARAVIPSQPKSSTTSMRIKWSITFKP